VTTPGRRRLRVTCLGTVQGVGFRPAVFRLATSLGLAGWVRNGPEGAVVEVEGEAPERLIEALPAALPPLARVDRLESIEVPTTGESGFEVTFSEGGRRERALVPPDTALCADCRREMADAGDRRHRYPFTTCTNCGPRFTLVRALPYDRERTSMGCFPLCPACRREYEDPADRRFHAEPVCCPECGPRLWLVRPGSGVRGPGSEEGEPGSGVRGPGSDSETVAEGHAAIERAREALRDGRIVAMKGLGGFQLACRADRAGPVAELRRRKRRPTKPFALMVADLTAARALVELSAADEALLASPRAPVVLAPGRPGAPLAEGIAPGLADVGVMVPTTPLHVELLRDLGVSALVMTSGNASDEPICRGNREALERLGGIADLYLFHDRDVVRRADDSVVRGGGRPFVVRRARGFVPEPLPLPVEAPAPVLALGPFLQATACLAVGGEAFVSQHVGDLDGEPARAFLEEVVDGLEEFLQARAGLIVVDEHPDYASTALGERLAAERGLSLLRVQHHLAHAAAVLAEHGAFPQAGAQAAALALDGTGWGTDGTAWGGEWLLLDGDLAWRRLASLEPLPLVGGEAAVREPWRVLIAALARAGALELLPRLPVGQLVAAGRLEAVARLATQEGWPLASGAGRLFEAAGALLGLAAVNGWEGEAAARFEALASSAWPAAPWQGVSLDSGPRTPDPGPRLRSLLPAAALLAEAARRAAAGEAAAAVAAGFHATFCRLAVELTARVMPAGVRTVAVGGGCLVNRFLREGLAHGLAGAGYDALFPQQLPPGDGGIAYGQAVLGAVAAATGARPREED
jgi:hydrogenase maturation protein HypF